MFQQYVGIHALQRGREEQEQQMGGQTSTAQLNSMEGQQWLPSSCELPTSVPAAKQQLKTLTQGGLRLHKEVLGLLGPTATSVRFTPVM